MKPIVIAHRGVGRTNEFNPIPENTITSFEIARYEGVDMIELDVVLSKDNIPVIFHDIMLNRITNKKGLLWSYTLDKLKHTRFRYRSIFFPDDINIPTFEETIRNFKDISFNVEIKAMSFFDSFCTRKERLLVDKVFHLIKDIAIENNYIVSSFKLKLLRYLRKLSKDIRISLLYKKGTTEEAIKKAVKYNLNGIHPKYILLTEEKQVQLAHKHGLIVCPYTVNEEEDVKRFVDYGVDGIITDNPSKVIAIIKDYL